MSVESISGSSKLFDKGITKFLFFDLGSGSTTSLIPALRRQRLAWNLICRPGWAQAHRGPPASASWVLELKRCATMAWLKGRVFYQDFRTGLSVVVWFNLEHFKTFLVPKLNITTVYIIVYTFYRKLSTINNKVLFKKYLGIIPRALCVLGASTLLPN